MFRSPPRCASRSSPIRRQARCSRRHPMLRRTESSCLSGRCRGQTADPAAVRNAPTSAAAVSMFRSAPARVKGVASSATPGVSDALKDDRLRSDIVMRAWILVALVFLMLPGSGPRVTGPSANPPATSNCRARCEASCERLSCGGLSSKQCRRERQQCRTGCTSRC